MTQAHFDSPYTNRPRLVIHSSLKHCGTVVELAKLAQAKGYQVETQDAHMINDVMIHEGFDNSAPLRNHSVRTAKRFLERHPGAL